MHSDFAPGRTFPDFVLPDRTNTEYQLSALQGDDPMLVVLIRSMSCPKDREQLAAVSRIHALLGSGCCKLVAITTDARRSATGVDEAAAAWSALLHDALCELTRELRRELAPRRGVDAPCGGGTSIDQTLTDMVAAYRDAGHRVPGRSSP